MIKIVAIALICAFVLVYLKSINSDLFSVALLGAGVIIVACGVEYLAETVDFFKNLSRISGVDNAFMSIILKITGIAYVVEFGAGIIDDLGLKNLSDKLVLVGKLAILTAAAPVIYAVFNLITGITV